MLKNKKFILMSLLTIALFINATTAQGTVTFASISTTAGINTLSNNDTYEKTIAVAFVFTPYINVSVENVSSPIIKYYCQVSGSSLILASTTGTASALANNTQQAKTATLFIDEESVAGQELESGSTIVVWAKLYNGTIATANYLGGDSTGVSYGNLVNSDSSSSGSSSLSETISDNITYIILITLTIVGCGIAVIWLISYKRSRLD